MATSWKKVVTSNDDATYLNANVSVTDLGGDGSTTTTFLNSAGSFATPSTGSNTTYTTSIPASTTKLRLTSSANVDDDIEFTGGTNVTVTRTNASQFTLSSTDTNTTYSAGSNMSLSGTEFSATDTNTQLSNAGVIGKVLTGMSTGTGGAVAVTDTIVVGMGKLEKRTALNDAKATDVNHNVTTNLSVSTDGTKMIVNSSDGTNATLTAVTTNAWGVMTDEMFDLLPTVAGADVTGSNYCQNGNINTNVTTNLSIEGTTGARTIASSDGTNAIIPSATDLVSGVMSKTDHIKLTGIETSATADQTVAEIVSLLSGDLGGNFVLGNQSSDKCTLTGDLTVSGDLVIDGSTVTQNVTTVTTEDHMITVAKDAEPTTTTGNQAGINVMTSGTESNHPSLHWLKDGAFSGWVAKQSSGTAYPIAIMDYHATVAPSDELVAGAGSFYFEADAKQLWLRVS